MRMLMSWCGVRRRAGDAMVGKTTESARRCVGFSGLSWRRRGEVGEDDRWRGYFFCGVTYVIGKINLDLAGVRL